MVTYKEIVSLASDVKTYTEKNHKLPTTKYSHAQLGYLFSKTIINPKKDYEVGTIKSASKGSGTNKSEKINKKDYLDMAKRVVSFIDKNKQFPNYVVNGSNKLSPSLYIYDMSKIVVYYSKNNKLPAYVETNPSAFIKKTTTTSTKKATAKSSNCSNPYKSSPHYTATGCNHLGQCTSYYCGPHCIHQALKKFGITNISEATLAKWAGTTTSGTGHDGLNTAIAKASKQSGVKLSVEWKNFSDFGKTNTERFREIGKLFCKSNKAVFFHIGYQCSGSCISGTVFGHYEMLDRIDTSKGTVRALNSLGNKCGSGYCGHLQSRSFGVQAHYISNISQKSVCIITKG